MTKNTSGTFHPSKPRSYGTTKAVVAAAFDEAGGVKTVAHLLGRSPTVCYGYADPQENDTNLSLDAARKLTRFCGVTAFAEDLAAEAGGVFLPVAALDSDHSELARLGAHSAKEFGEFIGRLMPALSDGAISAPECADLLREIADVLRPMLAARAILTELKP